MVLPGSKKEAGGEMKKCKAWTDPNSKPFPPGKTQCRFATRHGMSGAEWLYCALHEGHRGQHLTVYDQSRKWLPEKEWRAIRERALAEQEHFRTMVKKDWAKERRKKRKKRKR